MENVDKNYEANPHLKQITLKYVAGQVLASSVSNMLGLIIGYPLDTVKVRMQMSSESSVGTIGMLRGMIKLEGPFSLFKGMSSPLAGAIPYSIIIFTTNEVIKRKLGYLSMQEHNLSLYTGAFSGFIGNFFYVPVEVLKSRAQAQKGGKYTYREQLPLLLKSEGPRGLFKGFWATFWRDVPGWAVYFYAYEGLKVASTRFLSQDKARQYDFMIRLMCGGVAGQLSWIVSFPFDVVKTQMMCDMSHKPRTMRETFAQIYRQNGVRYFARGLTPTLLRAFPTNGVTLAVFDLMSERLE
ncbi:hypothetical protein FGO68_gene3304 [Halteria grandinella]|uniref:Mitochondrial carrier protein n=1 Tax=Halteria grandinella TaxID=5974 RepID=A0A8J8T064_HALGN|nr:hypothetical protein FGO68_gene3304 [Halteria grandinella]